MQRIHILNCRLYSVNADSMLKDLWMYELKVYLKKNGQLKKLEVQWYSFTSSNLTNVTNEVKKAVSDTVDTR